jgi:hypothetical protein
LKRRPLLSAGPGRLLRASWVSLFILAACTGRPPVLVPPAGSVAAVEGFGSASLQGAEAVLKGKFAFHFRAPDLGRIEALDPLGRTIFYLFLAGDRASLALPGERAYVEETPETLMNRLLGFSLLPDDMIRLLCGTWDGPAAGPGQDDGWRLEKDDHGRVFRGSRDDLLFAVREFFKGAGVPREIEFSRPGTTGRMKVLALRFDPPRRPEAFDTAFLAKYSRKTWEEIEEILKK